MSQDVVGSTSVQEEREPPSGRNHCIDGSNLSDLIRTLGARNDGGHGGQGEDSCAKLFRRALAWRKVAFRWLCWSINRKRKIVNRMCSLKEKECKAASISILIGEMVGCVVLQQYLVLQASVESWSVLGRGYLRGIV